LDHPPNSAVNKPIPDMFKYSYQVKKSSNSIYFIQKTDKKTNLKRDNPNFWGGSYE
jgi:hypothetical protein